MKYRILEEYNPIYNGILYYPEYKKCVFSDWVCIGEGRDTFEEAEAVIKNAKLGRKITYIKD